MSEIFRPYWQNCFLPDDEDLLKDEKLATINAKKRLDQIRSEV